MFNSSVATFTNSICLNVDLSFSRDQEELSAVCVFSLSDISKVMEGPFKELKKTCENWINPEPVPTPRPGQVLNTTTTTQILNVYYLSTVFYNNLFYSYHLVFEQCLQGWRV